MKEKILLLGGGGHCRSVIDVIEQENRFQVAGIIDRKELVGSKVFNYEIIGCDDDLEKLFSEFKNAFITVGQIQSPKTRIKLFELAKSIGYNVPSVISPLAYVSKYAKIGGGTVVMHHAIVNAGVSVGENCIINSKALIEHDSIVEDHCHISTGAIINGDVVIRKGTFVGSNAAVVEGVISKQNDFIKSGTVLK